MALKTSLALISILICPPSISAGEGELSSPLTFAFTEATNSSLGLAGGHTDAIMEPEFSVGCLGIRRNSEVRNSSVIVSGCATYTRSHGALRPRIGVEFGHVFENGWAIEADLGAYVDRMNEMLSSLGQDSFTGLQISDQLDVSPFLKFGVGLRF